MNHDFNICRGYTIYMVHASRFSCSDCSGCDDGEGYSDYTKCSG